MSYTAVLTQYKFTEEMHNTIKFSTREEQQGYFNINTLFNNPILENFNHNLGDGLNTTIQINKQSITEQTMGYNYCIVRDNNEEAIIKYYYYYITDIRYSTAGQVILQLKLDVLQTYYIDITFSDCLITRTMLDRFIKDEDGNIHFNYKRDSVLFEPESSSICPKRLVERKKLGVKINSEKLADMYEFFKNNVAYWVYVYISPNTYKLYSVNGVPQNIKTNTITHGTTLVNAVDGSTTVLCYPVMKVANATILVDNYNMTGNPIAINKNGYDSFIENNADGTDKIYNIKISLLPPFMSDNILFNIVNNTITITPLAQYVYTYRTSANSNIGLLEIRNQNIRFREELQLTTDTVEFKELKKTFTLEEIKENSNKPYLNPKMQSIEFMSVAVGVGMGDSYEYDPQKLGVMPFTFSYAEPLTAEISKYYISYNPKEDDEIYSKQTTTNYNGYIGSNDISIPYNNSQYASFISANKNFWLQKGIERTETIVNGVVGGASGGISGGLFGAIVGGLTGGITSTASVGVDIIKTKLNIDNMRASKQELKNAQGNAIFNLEIQDIGVTVELYKALDFEIRKANDMNILYGYTYNRLDNIKNHDNTRIVHNYIVANLEYMRADYPLSAIIVGEFKRLFLYGVRFWANGANIGNLTSSNYERSLQNGV